MELAARDVLGNGGRGWSWLMWIAPSEFRVTPIHDAALSFAYWPIFPPPPITTEDNDPVKRSLLPRLNASLLYLNSPVLFIPDLKSHLRTEGNVKVSQLEKKRHDVARTPRPLPVPSGSKCHLIGKY